MHETPAVAVLPYGARLGIRPASFPLDRMSWPLGQPDRLMGKALKDLSENDHIVMYPSDTVYLRPSFGTKANVSLMVVEPASIHGHHLRKLFKSHKKFHRVFSCNPDFLTTIPNGEFLVFGTTWVPEWEGLQIAKTKPLSLIASSKKSQEGHVLRHDLVAWMNEQKVEFDALGGGYAPFDAKSDGLAPYKFSVVIENIREPNYFTEKLVDSILCETVPIYWGSPNIADFFDTDCMIICETADELKEAILAIDDQAYQKHLPALKSMKGIAAEFGDLETRVANALLKMQ